MRTRSLAADDRFLAAVCLAASLCLPLAEGVAETIRFDSVSDWQDWHLPIGIVDLASDGALSTVPVRTGIDALRNAARFGGGIRGAGSSLARGDLVFDGDESTGWAPENALPEDRWLELDLGRAVAAESIELVFAADAPPFALFDLMLSTGEPAVDLVANPIPGTVVYHFRERFRENAHHRIRVDLDLDRHPFVRFLRVALLEAPRDGARLAEVRVHALGDNLSLGLPEKGGNIEIVIDVDDNSDIASLANSLPLADGDFSLWTEVRRINRQVDVISRMTLDLGAVFDVNHVRMVADFMRPPGQFRFNFEGYEVQTSDGSLAPDGTLIWHRQFAGRASPQNRDLGIASHRFSSLATRFVRIEWVFWDALCAATSPSATVPPCQFWGGTRELQVFGQGHPRRVNLRSPLIDLGGRKGIGALRWSSDTPPGTRIEVSSRTGDDLQRLIVYRDRDGKAVTQRRYEKLIPTFRGPIDTLLSAGGDWSPWSSPYLSSAEPFLSPVPRSFIELQVNLISSEFDGPTLKSLEIEFFDPIAAGALAEISPTVVVAGVETEFTYSLFPGGLRDGGFDRIEVESSAEMSFVSLRVGESEMTLTPVPTERGFRLDLPRAIVDEDLVELRFRTAVFVDGTRFDLFIEDRSTGIARQRVDAGEASADVDSESSVVRLPPATPVLATIRLSTSVLTPNSDGVNDRLEVTFDLMNALAPRRVELTIFDLSGRLMWESARETAAGQQRFEWSGQDAGGDRVAPGLYLLRVRFQADAGQESLTRMLAVAY